MLERLGRDTEEAVTRGFDRFARKEVDEPTFVRAAAGRIGRANAQATTVADRAVAAQITRQTGKPTRPAGVKPIDDQPRIRGAISRILHDDPKTPQTPQELTESRRGRLGRMANAEPHSAAQEATGEALKRQGVFGWVRALAGGPCPLCERWADGAVRSPQTPMLRHVGCRCIQRPAMFPPERVAKLKKGAKLLAFSLVDEAVGFAAAGLTGAATWRYVAVTRALLQGPTIFQRIVQFESFLTPHGVALTRGNYLVHGSGLLDALNLRRAGDLDLVASPALFEQIARIPGFRRLQAGVLKDMEILSNPKINAQVIRAVDRSPAHRRQYVISDLTDNAETIGGRQFVRRDLLAEMKAEAMREGAKVAKNERDIALLDGRLIWDDDVRRFGRLVNTGEGPMPGRLRGGRRRRRVIATVPQRRALQRYGKGSFELNRRLRGGVDLSDIEARQVRLIDEALTAHPTPARIKVYRGLRMSRSQALSRFGRPGVVVRDKGYLSTGLRETVARKYGQSGVYLELDVPAGTPSYFAPYRALTPNKVPRNVAELIGEDELLLPRNLAYRITEVVERPDGSILVRAEVIPSRLPIAPHPSSGRILGQAGWPDDVEGIAAELRRRHPDLDVDLGVSTPLHARMTASAVERMHRRYPAVVASLRQLVVTDQVPRPIKPNGQRMPYTPLSAGTIGLSGPNSAIGQRFLLINPYFAEDEAFLMSTLIRTVDEFAMRDMEGVVVHELGHHVLYAWTDRLVERLVAAKRAQGIPVWPDPGDADGFVFNMINHQALGHVTRKITDAVEAVVQAELLSPEAHIKIVRALSRYAHDLNDNDIHELVAEAITQVMMGKYRRSGDLYATGRPSRLARAIVDTVEKGLRATGLSIVPTEQLPPLGGLQAIRIRPGPRINPLVPYRTVQKEKIRLLAPGEGAAIHPDLIPDDVVAKLVKRHAVVPGFEDLRRYRNPRNALEEIIRRQTAFILEYAERSWRLDEAATRLHAEWYPFAHRWLAELADGNPNHGVSRPGAWAATASLSPGADWAHNVAWAKRVIEAISDDVEVRPEWIRASYDLEREAGRVKGRGGGRPRYRRELVGKRLSELNDEQAAYALRAWHDYDPVTQLGGHAGFGTPGALANPQSSENLIKAVKVLRDGSLENIDATLGGLKVRSFYMNLADPFDRTWLNVTIDSHHFGLANGAPWTTSYRFISTKAGSHNVTERPSHAGTGINGTYVVSVEATRRATEIFNRRHGTNFLPNQLQSITWELHRALYPRDYRTAELIARIEAIRTARARGRITRFQEAILVERARRLAGAPTRREILEAFGYDLRSDARPKWSDIRAIVRRRGQR